MKIAFTLALALATTAVTYADNLVTVRPTGTDSVNWSQLGSEGTPIPQQFSFTTTNGATGSGSLAGGEGEVRSQGPTWSGNFSDGDFVLWTSQSGPLTLNFAQGYTQIGAQIETDDYAGFTAQLCTDAGCFTEDGTSTSAGDGSAIYIGFQSPIPFSSITFNATNTDFAINSLTLNDSTAVTPEPSSLVLLATGLMGTAGVMRRRFVRS